MRLSPDPAAPLVGFVGRLDHQKGPDLVLDALPALAALGCQARALLPKAGRGRAPAARALVGASVLAFRTRRPAAGAAHARLAPRPLAISPANTPCLPKQTPPLRRRRPQVVMLGTGAPDYEAAIEAATRRQGAYFRGVLGFSVPLAHRLIAGCDILLMPSRRAPRAAGTRGAGAAAAAPPDV
jgi:glycosyltransferase involved in cell wall biosynthesis